MLPVTPEDYLLLSGIQHFAFCKRQWALIHLEQQWQENYLTGSGRIMHENADDPFFTESRGDTLISRAVPLVSHSLKLYGIADVVEYHRNKDGEGIKLPGREGNWTVIPVEYKHGKKKADDCDEVQVCTQGMCLEEMTGKPIPAGYLYYGKTRRRVEVVFDKNLRERVAGLVSDMYDVFASGTTPKAEPARHCESCSLKDICLPFLGTKKAGVDSYLKNAVLR